MTYSKLLDRLRRLRQRPRWAIRTSTRGVELVNETGIQSTAWSIAWCDIVETWAFKLDCFTVDQICLRLVHRDGWTVEASEEQEGWDQLTRCLPEYLPGHAHFAEWFMTVAFPAFEPNLTRLYPPPP